MNISNYNWIIYIYLYNTYIYGIFTLTHTRYQEISGEINAALKAYFPESRGVRIIAEPGRYFAASAFHLAVNVIARRRVTSDAAAALDATLDAKLDAANAALDVQQVPASGDHYMYYVNDGVYGSFNCMLYDHQVCDFILF